VIPHLSPFSSTPPPFAHSMASQPPISPQSLPVDSPIENLFDFDALSEPSPPDVPQSELSPQLSSGTSEQLITPTFSPGNGLPPYNPASGDTPHLQWLDEELAKYNFPVYSDNSFNNLFSFDSLNPRVLQGSGQVNNTGAKWPNQMPSPAQSQGSVPAIDPHLFSADTFSPGLPSFDDMDESEDEDDDDDDERASVARSGRKTAPSGGISKKTAGSVKGKEPKKERKELSLEEYKKLDPKSKRQERNKRSAQKFRERRKQYISQLENNVSDRDRMIAAIRDELASFRRENNELRSEIATLRSAVLDGRATVNKTVSTPALEAVAAPRPAPSPMPKVNPYKDITPSSTFWGGASMSGGITSVHTTLLPDLASNGSLSATLSGKMPPTTSFNINPLLNSPPPPSAMARGLEPLPNSFDSFAEANPFNIKSIDNYRMHLWSRLAKEAGAVQAQRERDNLETNPSITSLASSLRPAFFYAEAREEASKKAASKQAYLPTPPDSRAGSMEPEMRQALYAATLASQTLVTKLGAAFWEAFSGPAGSSSSPLDANKVRAVLEGKAVVRVVSLEEDPADTLIERMGSMSLKDATKEASRKMGPCMAAKDCVAHVRGVGGLFQHVQSVWREAPLMRR